MRHILPLFAALAVTACDQAAPPVRVDAANGTRVQIGSDDRGVKLAVKDGAGGVSMKLPGIDAQVKLPGATLDATRAMNIEGMAVHRGMKLGGMELNAGDGGGVVRMRYTDPAPPAAVIAHYRIEAPRVGYRLDRDTADALTAHKADGTHENRFSIVARPASGGGSEGVITVDDVK